MTNTLIQGAVHKRTPQKRSQAHTGIQPLSPLTHRTQKFQPLPDPLGEPPYHYDAKDAIPSLDNIISKYGKMIFHTVGDVGGIKSPEYQMAVAAAMKKDLYDLPEGEKPLFFHLLGDVVYYNGEHNEYYDQFYEPYNHYDAPIFAIAGNHDGDPIDDAQQSLDGWVAYFMTKDPHIDPVSRDAPRVTMSLPNVYYTLITPMATIIGMYTNVPEHGSIDSIQQQWLTNEMHTAAEDKAVIISLHHPIYSFDDHHSGSPAMADALQHAINDSRRLPNLVLTAHVHNYQRIEKEVNKKTKIPFLVAGHGGYYHLHNLTASAGDVDTHTGAKLVYGDAKNHGYVTLTVDAQHISGIMTTVDKETHEGTKTDSFSYSSKAHFLPDGDVISL